MNKYDVENYLPLAKEAVNKILANNPSVSDLGDYRNKMSGLSTAIVMNGLLPAMFYYLKNDENVVKLIAFKEEKNAKEYVDHLVELRRQNLDHELDLKKEEALLFATSLKLYLNLYK